MALALALRVHATQVLVCCLLFVVFVAFATSKLWFFFFLPLRAAALWMFTFGSGTAAPLSFLSPCCRDTMVAFSYFPFIHPTWRYTFYSSR